jgi:signal transduction histidine kinase
MLSDGQFFGTLCAVDPEPQALTAHQSDLLVVLGRIIATQIERDRELDARLQSEADKERLYRAAQDAVREREALLSIASHELRNPLAALLGFANLLQRRMLQEARLSDRDQRALQTIVTQAKRLDQMLGDLLDVSRLGSGQFAIEHRPLDISTLLHKTVEDMETTVSGHTVTIHDADNPVMVAADEERLAQVLRNLLGNAIKYSPHGGEINITIAADAGNAIITIQDQGIGIPADALPNLFQRFYRAPNTASHAINGFGIGLYVVKEIVTRHGGTIGVTSREGQGTTFTVNLPLLGAFS